MVASAPAVGQVIAYVDVERLRRRRHSRRLHLRCLAILTASVTAARLALADCAPREHAIRSARLRKLEELEEWANGGTP